MKKASLKLLPNGPVRLSVKGEGESFRDILFDSNNKPITIKKNSILCRCGKSKRQPFCDGIHRMCGFSSNVDEQDSYEVSKVVIAKHGAFDLIEDNEVTYKLCRCGASLKQPFCDDTHTSLKTKNYTF